MDNQNYLVSAEKLFDKDSLINITYLKQALAKEFLIDYKFVKYLIDEVSTILKNQPNLIYLQEPLRIIGDIHGQYWDLLKILSLCPSLESNPSQKLLFLGDYVDRGIQGTQVTILLLAMKVRYPKQVFLLRGNHQSRQMTQMNNFFYEFTSKYCQDFYFRIMDTFDLLPLACIVNHKYFCVHGGICPEVIEWDNINKMNQLERMQEIPYSGQICDFIWADPSRNQNGSCEGTFQNNQSRGCSIYFGAQLTHRFLKRNNLTTVIRAHQIIDKEGYKKHVWPGWNNVPTVVTIFSAPNYCGTFCNKAVILSVKDNKLEIRQFNQQNPKNYVPEKYEAFNLTIPKLFDLIDKLCHKMVKAYTTKLLPESDRISDQKKLGLIVEYLNKTNNSQRETSSIQLKSNSNLVNIDKSGFTDEYFFRRSVGYFANKEKRPSSKVFLHSNNKTSI